jgi:hypothetical protein
MTVHRPPYVDRSYACLGIVSLNGTIDLQSSLGRQRG